MTDSKKIEDGGPAFARSGFFHPDGRPEHDNRPEEGMSLRDWFAGQVDPLDVDVDRDYAAAICGRPQPEGHSDLLAIAAWWAEANAKYRYLQADAMIAARKTGEA